MLATPDTTIIPESKANPGLRLTQQVKAGGCASKLPPGILNAILQQLPRQSDDRLMVGFDKADDAGVYRITDELALVQTVDFFTPMVDDPYTYGRIAATNALSDVYAMGGRAVTALSIVCFPQGEDPSVLQQIMLGGLRAMEDAGCIVVGGHSVRDAEIKFGYSVTGLIDPGRVFTNCAARPHDAIILTKAIGTGVITTALKQSRSEHEWVAAAIASMTHLNRAAAEITACGDFHVHAITDVTGFGLIGHAREMALGSGLRMVIELDRIPLLPGALDAVDAGCIPAGLNYNREFAECFVAAAPEAKIAVNLYTLLYDPQTSGGLLIALPQDEAPRLTDRLCESGYPAAIIGHTEPGSPKILLR